MTIDGPSGVGKGTVSLRVAKQLGWQLLESGALYRVLALQAQDLKEESRLARLASQLKVKFEIATGGVQVIWEGQDVTAQLRSESCGKLASQIAALPAVRQALLDKQRAFQRPPGLVAEGRDMGSVVFPEAFLKIFLTASCQERAQRRYNQLKEKGINVKLNELIDELNERDQRDSTRAVAPLKIVREATVIDTTGMAIEQVVAQILTKLSESPLCTAGAG